MRLADALPGPALTLTLLAVSCSAPPAPVDLSPASWPEGDLEEFLTLTNTWGEADPLARGPEGAISGTSAALAVRAGMEALKQGGTAIDAALTHAMADIVLLASCCVSHAGFMTLVYYEAATGETYSLNGAWNSVRGQDPRAIPTLEEIGAGEAQIGPAVMVPGFMRGAEAAHQRFGKLPWASLFDPAIYFAENGTELSPAMAGMIAGAAESLETRPETKAFFTNDDGEWYEAGDVFPQSALASTLRHVASEGADYMYTGAWAQKLVDVVQESGGHLTMGDMAAYEPIWGAPAHTTFRDYEVHAIGLPNVGGVNMVEALNLAELADLRSEGHFAESGESLNRLMRIARVGEVMGTSLTARGLPGALIADYAPDLSVGLEDRITKESAASLWSRMQTEAWTKLDRRVLETQHLGPTTPGHSDAVVAVDRWGNAAALLHTLNAAGFGGLGLMIDGVSISGAASYQQDQIADAGPGNRLPEATNPVIVTKDGKPVLVSSSIGMGVHEQTLQSILSVLEFGLDPSAAVDGPQFFRPVAGGSRAVRGEPVEDAEAQVVAEGTFPEEVLAAAQHSGLWIRQVPIAQSGAYRGYWVGIYVDPETGERQAASPWFLNGRALAH